MFFLIVNIVFFLIVISLFFFSACTDMWSASVYSYCFSLCGYFVKRTVCLRAAISRTSSRTSPTRCTLRRRRRRPAGPHPHPPPRATHASSYLWSRRPSATSMQTCIYNSLMHPIFSSSRASYSSIVRVHNSYCNRAPLNTHLFRTLEYTHVSKLYIHSFRIIFEL